MAGCLKGSNKIRLLPCGLSEKFSQICDIPLFFFPIKTVIVYVR